MSGKVLGPRLYVAVVGLAIGSLVTGVALPFAVGERAAQEVSSAGGVASGAGAAADPAGSSPTAPGVEAAAPGEATDGSATAPTTAPASPGTTAPASAAATGGGGPPLRIGFLLLDVASATRFAGGLAGIDPEQQRRAIEVYLADVNRRGGINGRQVQGVYRTFDVLDKNDQRAACIELTVDKKVFAVVAAGGYSGDAVLCITKENRTPFVNLSSGGTPSQYVAQSGGMLFTLFQLGERQMRNWVAELDARRALAGRRIGILSDESSDPGDLVVGGSLLPALERAGHQVAHRSTLAADLASGASQIPVEVQQMRSKQVDVVLLPAMSTYATQFVQAAEGQGWSPAWYVTDFGNLTSQAIAADMPAGFEGALATTVTRTGEERVDAPEPKVDADCRALYEKATGEPLPRMEDGDYNNTYGTTLYSCGMVRLVELAAKAAGAQLTKPAFSGAMQRLGPVPLPRFGGGSFRPGKFDAADLVRTLRWHGDCTCWKAAGPFHPSRF